MELTSEVKMALRPVLLKTLPEYIYAKLNKIMDVVIVNDAHRREVEKNPKGACVSVCLVLQLALQYFEIPVRVVKVCEMFLNTRAQELVKTLSGSDFVKELQKRGPNYIPGDPWTVGLGYPDKNLPKEMYAVHSVIFFPDGSILDPTAAQATRPEKGLVVENYWETIDSLPAVVGQFMVSREQVQLDSAAILRHPEFPEIVNYATNTIRKALMPILIEYGYDL